MIRNEYPGITCQLLDIGDTAGLIANDASLLVRHMLALAPEPEVAIRHGVTFAHRLQNALSAERFGACRSATFCLRPEQPVELVIGTPGRLDSLQYRSMQRCPPATRRSGNPSPCRVAQL